MPTVVDSLVVTLGLDPAKFKAGEREVTAGLKRVRDQSNTTAKEMEASGKQAAQFFAQAKIEALGLIGTLVGAGGMLAFTKNATQSLADLGRNALNIGVAIPQLNAFQNVIERNGGSAESATASMKGLVDQIERFKVFGDPSVFKFLNPIGANINDTPLAIWQKFVEFADKHRNDPALVNLIGHGLGFDQGLINASLQIRGAADAARQLADEVQRVATPEMVQNATELQKAWADLQHQAVFTGEAVLNNLSPALRSVLVWGKDEIAQNPALIEGITAVVGALVSLGAIRISAGLMGLTGLSTAIGALVGFMERLAPYAALLLSLHGDTPTHEDTEVGPGGEFFGENGAFGKWWSRTMPEWLGGASPTHTADTDMSPEQRAFLDTLAAGESKGYDDINPSSGARGRYQFLGSTNAEVSKQTGIFGFDPVSQDRKAWFYASTTYLRKTGRDLANDLRAGGHEQDITNALNGVWPSLPGGSQQNTTAHQFATRMRDNLAANSTQRQATAGTPVPPMLPGEPAPIAHSRPAGPDLSHLTNRPVGATLGNWLWNRLDPALVPQPGGAVSNTSNNTSVHIGTQVIHSRADDAAGIAGDIRDATTDAFIQQANRGLQ